MFGSAETLDEMQYQQRLEKNLEKAPTKGLLQKEIDLRPSAQGPCRADQAFNLAVVEPGKFDLEDSFIDEEKQASLHVLARPRSPRPLPRREPTPAEAPAPRGDFTTR